MSDPLASERDKLLVSRGPNVHRMRYVDVPRATETIIKSFRASNDPLNRYLHFIPEETDTKWRRYVSRVLLWITYANFVRLNVAWTINGGESTAVYLPVRTQPKSWIEIFLDTLVDKVKGTLRMLIATKEELKRDKEFAEKAMEGIKLAFGDRVTQLAEIRALCTDPALQHRGYSSTLVRMITDKVDFLGQSSWLASSNIAANTGFYNSLGFVTVAEVFVGEKNPSWTEPRIPIHVMVREFIEKN